MKQPLRALCRNCEKVMTFVKGKCEGCQGHYNYVTPPKEYRNPNLKWLKK